MYNKCFCRSIFFTARIFAVNNLILYPHCNIYWLLKHYEIPINFCIIQIDSPSGANSSTVYTLHRHRMNNHVFNLSADSTQQTVYMMVKFIGQGQGQGQGGAGENSTDDINIEDRFPILLLLR